MAYQNFNHNDAIDSIKANLFDIYEEQERIIGGLADDELKQRQINDFIRIKDTAVNLIDAIENLYINNYSPVANIPVTDEITNNQDFQTNESNSPVVDNNLDEVNNDIVSETENIQNDNPVLINVDDSYQEPINQEVPDIAQPEVDSQVNDIENVTIDPALEISNTESEDTDDDDDDGTIEEMTIPINIEEEPTDNQDEDSNINVIDNNMVNEEMETPVEVDINDNRNLFYLDDRNGRKPNFAYVPQILLDRIKQNGVRETTMDMSSDKDSNKFYKEDKEKPKGIIVRNDQYMKLALSRYRQESVIRDAKMYRIEQAKASRIKLEQEQNDITLNIA